MAARWIFWPLLLLGIHHRLDDAVDAGDAVAVAALMLLAASVEHAGDVIAKALRERKGGS